MLVVRVKRPLGGGHICSGHQREQRQFAISPEQLRLTTEISRAQSKQLGPLLAGSDPSQARPSIYCGSKEGSIDSWNVVMRQYLQLIQANATLDDKTWSNIGHLDREARNYIINKADSERGTPEKVFELLASRSGTGGYRMQVRRPAEQFIGPHKA